MLAASSISNKFLCPIIYQLDKNLKTSVILFLSLFEVMLINEITRKEKRAMRNVIQYNLQKEAKLYLCSSMRGDRCGPCNTI
ncbi:unnamed protein product [Brugia timori]|uniref:G_PROTEIN_RECEP_F1_2 domain-containing protein n=1 Tax=Brugia timori TaxID=42155 RepID=A0A0R3QM63_9BILA|nr:unnamed protein product [Brugia timori]